MNRVNIINNFIKKYNYKNYLEIGVRKLSDCFNNVICENKWGVDPDVEETNYSFPDKGFKTTSDNFFAKHSNLKFDLIFLDGDHSEQQVDTDISNSLNSINDNGTIILHDCNPLHQGAEALTQNGTVWRAFYKARRKYKIDAYVIDTDYGVGVIRKNNNATVLESSNNDPALNYSFLEANRLSVLNLISVEKFKKL